MTSLAKAHCVNILCCCRIYRWSDTVARIPFQLACIVIVPYCKIPQSITSSSDKRGMPLSVRKRNITWTDEPKCRSRFASCLVVALHLLLFYVWGMRMILLCNGEASTRFGSVFVLILRWKWGKWKIGKCGEPGGANWKAVEAELLYLVWAWDIRNVLCFWFWWKMYYVYVCFGKLCCTFFKLNLMLAMNEFYLIENYKILVKI